MATASAPSRHRFRDAGIVAAAVVGFVVALMAIAALADAGGHRRTGAPPPTSAPATDPVHQAQDWLAENLEPRQRLVVDASASHDLMAHGVSEDRLVSVPPSGPPPDALAGWREYDYVVSTPALRDQLTRLPSAQAAIDSSMPVAAFGTGAARVEVRRIVPEGLDEVRAQAAASMGLRQRAGTALAGNPNVGGSPEALDLLRSGRVDERVLNVLATYSVAHRLQIGGFPAVAGEDEAGMPRRLVTVDSIDGQLIAGGAPAAAAMDVFLGAQQGEYRPASVTVDAPVLRIAYVVAEP